MKIFTQIKSRILMPKMLVTVLFLMVLFNQTVSAQRVFAHPGISHKRSDLDRMKYMVQAGKEPWKTSFANFTKNPYASYTYTVQGNSGITSLVVNGTDAGFNYEKFKYDALAAYYNAIMWYITGDERNAKKAVEIFNAWVNLRNINSGGTRALDAGRVIWKMLEGAEIIKSTYTGWSSTDLAKFKAMLVYPGYSTALEPTAAIASEDVTFYWFMYNGDPGRHGNQGLFAMRGIMAMGIFLDNEIMYDRALRYLTGQPHRSDDLPYPPGPRSTEASPSYTNDYYDEYTPTASVGNTPDYGYNETISNYIWENGQPQEASRDQSHTVTGVAIINTLCEMAWNQGNDMYSFLDYRPLLGIEFGMRYNASLNYPFPDQPTPWEPTVQSGEFIQRRDRSGRWFSKKMNPYSEKDLTRLLRGTNFKFSEYPFHEMALAHYRDRVGLNPDRYKWLQRVFDISTRESGVEGQGFQVDFPGWGGLTFRRAANCPGDPVEYVNGQPVYRMNLVPGKIEAENFDHFTANGQGKVYNDKTTANTGGQYRTGEAVDIAACSEGGYALTGLESGEWVNYTIAVPQAGTYKLKMRYSAVAANGALKVAFDGADRTGAFGVPFGSVFSNGADDWREITVGSAFTLQAGVQSMRVLIGGTSNAFNINNFTLVYVGSLQPQTINFNNIPVKKMGDIEFDPGATASSGLPVTYTSSNPSVATIIDNKIHIIGSGVVTITAAQPGDDNYAAAANVAQTLTITGIAAGDYMSTGNMAWNGGIWNISDGNGGISGTTTTAPTSSINVHIMPGHTVTLATTAGVSKNLTVYNGATLLQQVALTVSGLTVISGTETMSGTLTVNELSITDEGVVASLTAPAGSVQSLITNKATTIAINGRLGAPAGSAVTTVGAGIRIFVNATGTTTFTGDGVMNIARFSPNGNQAGNQDIVIDMNMEARNYAGSGVSSFTLQNGNNGTSIKTLTINAGKTVTINGQNGQGAFHGQYGTGYGWTGVANTGGTMTYNINGTLDCSTAQFNLVANQNTATNSVIVNVNGVLKLGSTVRLFRFQGTQKIGVNIGDDGIVDGSTAALNLNPASSGQSINGSNFTGTAAVATGLGGVAFNANNPVVGTYSFVGNGGSDYVTAPAVFFTGGTLSTSTAPTYAVANITDGKVTGITVISTGNYTVKPTGLQFVGGGAPTQWFAMKGDNQSGTFTRLTNAGVATPLWIGAGDSYNPVTVKPAVGTVFTANVKQGGLIVGLPYEGSAINRSWDIQPAAISATDLTFGYNATDANSQCDVAAVMRLVSGNAATLSNVQAAPVKPVTAQAPGYQVSFTGVNSFPVFNLLNTGKQTISFGPLQPVMVNDADFDGGATSTSTLPIQYTSADNSVATIENGKIHIVSAGTVTITASQIGDVYYLDADSVSTVLTINKKFFVDGDNDGIGAGAAVLFAQNDAPAGYSADSTDCNDNDVAVQKPLLYYIDADHDGFGAKTVSASFCTSTPPAGYVANNLDCDDTRLLYAHNDGDGRGAGTPVACGGDAIGDVTAYPNPVIGNHFVVKTPDYLANKQITVTLTDLLGKVMYQKTVLNTSGTIDVQPGRNVKPGIYVLKVNNVTKTKMLIL